MPLPDYPSVLFRGQARIGNPIRPFEARSNNNGITEHDLGAINFFHTFSLAITDVDPSELHFVYRCTFLRNGQNQISPSYANGEQCPSFVPDRIRSMNLWLGGKQADRFVLRYSGRVQFRGPHNPSQSYDNLAPNEWCGTPPGQGAPEEWIARLQISLRRD